MLNNDMPLSRLPRGPRDVLMMLDTVFAARICDYNTTTLYQYLATLIVTTGLHQVKLLIGLGWLQIGPVVTSRCTRCFFVCCLPELLRCRKDATFSDLHGQWWKVCHIHRWHKPRNWGQYWEELGQPSRLRDEKRVRCKGEPQSARQPIFWQRSPPQPLDRLSLYANISSTKRIPFPHPPPYASSYL